MEFLERARNTHGYKYDYPLLPNKLTLRDSITISLNGDIYEQNVSKHLMGRCIEKSTPKKTTEEFIKESKVIWGDKYDYSLTEYNGALNYVKIIFDGVIYEQRASSHLEGLSPEVRKNKDFLVKEIIRTGNEIGKKEIEDFLIKYKLDYIRGYQVGSLEFDFYLPSARTFVEFDGRHHFEPIIEFGGLETLNRIKSIDKEKNDYCEDNYINLIRIKFNSINEIYVILWENLKKYID